ncbi:hypothetical protein JOB18_009503 [Solea senegalensis]|uniref:Uncharacterized protein n=1 Tax=Solea senegalensis TaxID=28829 RepID=A0AAV6QV47_SOLSE|nr:hypothetical protein JOB18_009503 [Solea senegalensis]
MFGATRGSCGGYNEWIDLERLWSEAARIVIIPVSTRRTPRNPPLSPDELGTRQRETSECLCALFSAENKKTPARRFRAGCQKQERKCGGGRKKKKKAQKMPAMRCHPKQRKGDMCPDSGEKKEIHVHRVNSKGRKESCFLDICFLDSTTVSFLQALWYAPNIDHSDSGWRDGFPLCREFAGCCSEVIPRRLLLFAGTHRVTSGIPQEDTVLRWIHFETSRTTTRNLQYS